MLQIHHAEDDARSPSKLYADACWAANPRLSPDWWREALGYTVGKLALDWRTQVSQTEYLATGCNLVLATPATWPQVVAATSGTLLPPVGLNILMTSTPAAAVSPLPPMLAWQAGNADFATRQTTLILLENMVKQGQIEAYGLALESSPDHPLHLWLEEAAEAALTVYARRKRPALRFLVAPLDLLNLSLLTDSNTLHKSESVSTLELAARLNLAVIATAPTLPSDADIAEAIQSLTAAAEAENTLNQALGGWPQIHGQPLFSVLAHLAHGQSPWPTPHHWHAWHTHLWPQLQSQWPSISQSPAVTAYLAALGNLLPHAEALALGAAQPLLNHLLGQITPAFPPAWQNQTASTHTLALLTSIPGLTAVAPAVPFDPNPLQQLPNLPDIGALLPL